MEYVLLLFYFFFHSIFVYNKYFIELKKLNVDVLFIQARASFYNMKNITMLQISLMLWELVI